MTDQIADPELGGLAPTAPAPGAPRVGARSWRVFGQNRMAMAGLVMLVLIAAAALLGPLLSPYDTTTQDILRRYEPPTLEHPMGTDELGRDVMTRVLAGGRLSLGVGLAATLIAVVIGITVGALAGFWGGWVDNVLMRLVDLALSLPDLFLLILASALLGPSVITMVLIIGLVRWMNMARLVRASFLSLREREFVEAARAVGARPARLILVHLLPNSLGPIVVAGTLAVASAIIAESTLSFLGLGIQPPASSWGAMLRNAQSQIFTSPQLAVFPGLMIFLTVIAINFIGDGLRDALDPRTLHVDRRARRELEALLQRGPMRRPEPALNDPI
jgi:peptide/nickel transport system permease protein